MILSSESLINGMSLSHLFYPLHLLLCVCVCTCVWPCTACMWMVVRGHMQGLAEFFATWVQVSFLSTWHKLRSNGKRNPPLRKCLGKTGLWASLRVFSPFMIDVGRPSHWKQWPRWSRSFGLYIKKLSSAPPQLLIQFLPWLTLQWTVRWWNTHTKLLWVMVFIVAVKSKLGQCGCQGLNSGHQV